MQKPMPRLSADLKGPRTPNRCQSCGGTLKLARWQEHDEADRPEQIVVVLCCRCERLIEPHPRLYAKLHNNAPWPGCMSICWPCRHRQGVECVHPLQVDKSGPGVRLAIAEPSRAHVSYTEGGRRKGRWETIWPSKAEACAQREPMDVENASDRPDRAGRPGDRDLGGMGHGEEAS